MGSVGEGGSVGPSKTRSLSSTSSRRTGLSELLKIRVPLVRFRSQPAGVYQIGDVHARSWIETGSPFGTGTPRRTASIVLQRGVGISRART